MIDSAVQRLLETAIDSPVKLQLLLHFSEHPHFTGTAHQIGQRIFRDIWTTQNALHQLCEDGVCTIIDATKNPTYAYRPDPQFVEAIERLVVAYNEPIVRDALQSLLQRVARDADYRRMHANTPFELQRFA